MLPNKLTKNEIKEKLVSCLSTEKEIKKIIIFGSFIFSDTPNDIDVAIFQDSREKYLPLVLKYRNKTRSISKEIPLDIFPLKPNIELNESNYSRNPFLTEIEKGEIIYERRDKKMA